MILTSKLIKSSAYPYFVELTDCTDDECSKVYEWCKETFGIGSKPGRNVIDARWLKPFIYDGVRFKHEADRIWFVMRWS